MIWMMMMVSWSGKRVGGVGAEAQVSVHEVDEVGHLPDLYHDGHVPFELTLVVPQQTGQDGNAPDPEGADVVTRGRSVSLYAVVAGSDGVVASMLATQHLEDPVIIQK